MAVSFSLIHLVIDRLLTSDDAEGCGICMQAILRREL